jgi:hypothetical protein
LIVYLADDDSLLSEPLMAVCSLFEADPSLAAVYCDHICWDDAQGTELHRYSYPDPPVEFRDNPTGLVEFLLREQIAPEVGVFRRSVFMQAEIPHSRAMPFHVACYHYGRLGTVRFDPTCFYREHWILKPHLQRTYWNNQTAFDYIGDEQRLGLEAIVRLAERDSGLAWDRDYIRFMIDKLLLDRTTLEIRRACERQDYILAVELRRRQALWHWKAPAEHDAALSKAAAEQAKVMMGGGDVEQLAFVYRV